MKMKVGLFSLFHQTHVTLGRHARAYIEWGGKDRYDRWRRSEQRCLRVMAILEASTTVRFPRTVLKGLPLLRVVTPESSAEPDDVVELTRETLHSAAYPYLFERLGKGEA